MFETAKVLYFESLIYYLHFNKLRQN